MIEVMGRNPTGERFVRTKFPEAMWFRNEGEFLYLFRGTSESQISNDSAIAVLRNWVLAEVITEKQ